MRQGTESRAGAWAVMLAALVSCAPIRAQLLNLPAGAAPAPAPPAGTGVGAIGLADRLREEAAGIDAGADDAPARARAAVRRAAAELLIRGEAMGLPGSPRVLLGRTLAARKDAWDTLLRAGTVPEPVAALIAHDLGVAFVAGSPVSPEAALRNALADLVNASGPPRGAYGWIEGEPPPGDLTPSFSKSIDAWAAVPGVQPATVAALRALDSTLIEADRWAAYQRSAARTRLLLLGAAGCLDEREWVDPAARRALAEEFDGAAGAYADPAARDGATPRLLRLAAVGELMRATDRLDAAGPTAGAVRRSRAALVQAAAAAPGDPSTERRILENSRRVLALALAREDLPAEGTLVRQARPAWRHLLAAARRDEPQMLAALPEIFRRADAITDPGVVAAVGRMQRAIEDLQGLAALSGVMPLASPEPGREPLVSPDWEPVAARVLELGQRMQKGDEPDRMVQHLRTFSSRVSRLMRLPGEERLDAALAAGGADREVWAALTGAKEADLPPDIADRRRVWIRGWTQGKDDTEASEIARLENLRLLMDTLDDATRVEAVLRAAADTGEAVPPVYQPLQSWPGWEMSIEALRGLHEGLAERLAKAVIQVLGPDQDKAAKDLEAIRAEYAPIRLCGRLLARCEDRGLGQDAGPASAAWEVGTGGPWEVGPGASWMGVHRAAIADVCRYAEELEPALSLGDKERAARLRTYVNARAAAALEDG